MLPGGRWWGSRLGGGGGEGRGIGNTWGCAPLCYCFILGHGCGYGYGVTDELRIRVLWNEWAFAAYGLGYLFWVFWVCLDMGIGIDPLGLKEKTVSICMDCYGRMFSLFESGAFVR